MTVPPSGRENKPPGALLGRSWGGLGRSWGALGRSCGALGALLGRSWGAPGRSWALLGAPGAIFARFSTPWGSIFVAPWADFRHSEDRLGSELEMSC